ncbi:sugar kinase, partial [Yoonia sp.]|uniref:sugar kinase n=1 Tax=Yoonia sp. TaxID=2212373 RepID=UPI0019F59E21
MTQEPRIFLGLGECMVELAPTPDGTLQQGFAGDVFNTLWYAAQTLGPGWAVRFQTALGADALSDELVRFAQDAGIDCSTVPRLAGAMPGLYMIRLKDGERSFLYWRGQSAARRMMENAGLVAAQMAGAGVVYLSGITLAILPPDARAALTGMMAQARAGGALIVFDPNIRPALWDSPDIMRRALTDAASAATLVLPSFDDEASAFGDASPAQTAARYHSGGASIVV